VAGAPLGPRVELPPCYEGKPRVVADPAVQLGYTKSIPQPPRWLGARPRFGGASALSPGRWLGDGPVGVAEFLRKLAGREDPTADLLGEARPGALQGTAHVRMRVQDANAVAEFLALWTMSDPQGRLGVWSSGS